MSKQDKLAVEYRRQLKREANKREQCASDVQIAATIDLKQTIEELEYIADTLQDVAHRNLLHEAAFLLHQQVNIAEYERAKAYTEKLMEEIGI